MADPEIQQSMDPDVDAQLVTETDEQQNELMEESPVAYEEPPSASEEPRDDGNEQEDQDSTEVVHVTEESTAVVDAAKVTIADPHVTEDEEALPEEVGVAEENEGGEDEPATVGQVGERNEGVEEEAAFVEQEVPNVDDEEEEIDAEIPAERRDESEQTETGISVMVGSAVAAAERPQADDDNLSPRERREELESDTNSASLSRPYNLDAAATGIIALD
jgi:hypothetical protein